MCFKNEQFCIQCEHFTKKTFSCRCCFTITGLCEQCILPKQMCRGCYQIHELETYMKEALPLSLIAEYTDENPTEVKSCTKCFTYLPVNYIWRCPECIFYDFVRLCPTCAPLCCSCTIKGILVVSLPVCLIHIILSY